MVALALAACLTLYGADRAVPQDTAEFVTTIRLNVADTTSLIERPIGRALVLQLRRVPQGRLTRFGWQVAVLRRPVRPGGWNLLYHSRNLHGPYPTDILAWIQQRQYYPDERVLSVYGQPYEIRIRLIDCRTSGTGEDAQFETGTIEVGWRRALLTSSGGAFDERRPAKRSGS
jgi:hypothetical protein